MEYVRRKVEERSLVEEAIDSDGIGGFGHVEENCAGEQLYAEIPGYFFKEAGQLQGHAMSGSEPKLLISQQLAFIYYIQDPI
jgi:hypothetical protein